MALQHRYRFGEAALFFLLLAPWESWSTMQEIDWRGFRVPWIYTLNDDLFVRPSPPPSPDSLTLEPWIVEDSWGEEIELERPTELRLDDAAKSGLALFTDAAWQELEAARSTSLFETPIAHFLVRAFLADGMDEVMAHMTAIEAAMGLEMDHKKWMRPKPDAFAHALHHDVMIDGIEASLDVALYDVAIDRGSALRRVKDLHDPFECVVGAPAYAEPVRGRIIAWIDEVKDGFEGKRRKV